MGTNYGLYNQQPTHYFNNATYSRTGYNNNMSKNYYSGIEKTSSRAFFQYNYTPTPSQAYYQTNQPSMYSPPASPSSQQPPLVSTTPPQPIPTSPKKNRNDPNGIQLSKSKTLSRNFKVTSKIISEKIIS